MSIQFQDTQSPLSAVLSDITKSIKEESITLQRLMTLIGEEGLLLFAMFLTIPFLVPVSIPGVSTVFGAAIILIGIGVTLNRIPWLPKPLMQREFKMADLRPVLERGAKMMARLDNIVRPRMLRLTQGMVMNRVNGAALTFGGVLLIFPFGFIPFSNTLPAWAILCLGAGILQRDGLLIALGYVLLLATLIYFGFLFVGALLAGASLSSLLAG